MYQLRSFICVFLWISTRWSAYFFFFNDTATTEIYTLSLHDALPISESFHASPQSLDTALPARQPGAAHRSEEHTSELQSHSDLVCRLLLEKKKIKMSLAIKSTQ